MNTYAVGLDIGGTKCAATLGDLTTDINIVDKKSFATARLTPYQTIDKFSEFIEEWLKKYKIFGIGISCGGPLDAKKGVIMSPPNLPEWDNVKIVEILTERFNIPVYLQNDANACAVAEWKFGAGKGYNNIVFLTFGTGLGAGLILDKKLYSGTNDNAGEIGHVRLTASGPVGYNKAGSVEGYCSGGGIRELAILEARKLVKKGKIKEVSEVLGDMKLLSAKSVAERAFAGDEFSIGVYNKSGNALGKFLSMIIDFINPERIIIGGVFMRSHELLLPAALKVIKKETLAMTREVCEIVPAGLGEKVGDYAALALAKGDY